MLTEYEWNAIGGYAKQLTPKTPFVTDIVKPLFERVSNLEFVKNENGGITYDGVNVRGWHIFGMALKGVALQVDDAMADAAEEPVAAHDDAAGPSRAEVQQSNKKKKRKHDDSNLGARGKRPTATSESDGNLDVLD